jgi:hypothetical protein
VRSALELVGGPLVDFESCEAWPTVNDVDEAAAVAGAPS